MQLTHANFKPQSLLLCYILFVVSNIMADRLDRRLNNKAWLYRMI